MDWNRGKSGSGSLSGDVIRSRMVDISFNNLKSVDEKLAAWPIPFSMELDETTDVS